MTYNVYGGTLNPAQSNPLLCWDSDLLLLWIFGDKPSIMVIWERCWIYINVGNDVTSLLSLWWSGGSERVFAGDEWRWSRERDKIN